MDGAPALERQPAKKSRNKSRQGPATMDAMDSPESLPPDLPIPAEPAIEPVPSSPDAGARIEPHRVVEAILFASDSPLNAGKIASILGIGDARDVRKHIERLNEHYEREGLSFRIDEIAGGFQMLTQPIYNTWLVKLLRAREDTRLSPAALETLAIIAYKQPCTRADIEAIRGVAAGDLVNRLRELNLVKMVGRAEDLGRPILYGTTRRFLEVFGLAALEDLPQVEALKAGAAAKPAVKPAGLDDPLAQEKVELPPADAESSPTLNLVHESDDEAADDSDATTS